MSDIDCKKGDIILKPDRSEILRSLRIYHKPGDVFEIRVPKAGKSRTISGYFKDIDKAVDAVLEIPDEAEGIYFTINPTVPTLIARSNNRLKFYAKTTTADKDILKLNWLPIDLDAVRAAGISSTDSEHNAAIRKAEEIRDWLIKDQTGLEMRLFWQIAAMGVI